MSEARCYACGGENGKREKELRPYGPNGAWVCFKCATSTPDSNRAAVQQYAAQLDAAAALSDEVFIGEVTGPRPNLGKKVSKRKEAAR